MLNSGLQYIAGYSFLYLWLPIDASNFSLILLKKRKNKKNITASLGLCFFIDTTYLPSWIHLPPHQFLKTSAPDSHDPSPHKFWVALTITQMSTYCPVSQVLDLILSCDFLLLSDLVAPTYRHTWTESLPWNWSVSRNHEFPNPILWPKLPIFVPWFH